MKNILLALTLAATGISDASAVTTIFSIPTGTTNAGTFTLAGYTTPPGSFTLALKDFSDLAPGSAYTHGYAYRFFTPSVTGSYALGMTNASYDPVILLYEGITSFNVNNPQSGNIGINDDGNWEYPNLPDQTVLTYGNGTINVNSTAAGGNPSLMPLLEGQVLTAGTNYLVAITTFNPADWPDSATTTHRGNNLGDIPSVIPLPADFFVVGPGAVTLGPDGAVAVPEPGAWTASLLLVIGAWFTNGRRRRKVA